MASGPVSAISRVVSIASFRSASATRPGEAEDAFVWVTHYERGFWDTAMSGQARPASSSASVRTHTREPIGGHRRHPGRERRPRAIAAEILRILTGLEL
jgi:hypothetical protein